LLVVLWPNLSVGVQTAARGAVCVFCRLRLKFLEKVLRAFLRVAQLHRRGKEATKQFLHAWVDDMINTHYWTMFYHKWENLIIDYPSTCMKLFAINLTLNICSSTPSIAYFFLNAHLYPTIFWFFGRSTSVHVYSSSSFIAIYHYWTSTPSISF